MGLKQDGIASTKLMCLSIRTSDGLLWTWQWTFVFSEMRRNSWISKNYWLLKIDSALWITHLF